MLQAENGNDADGIQGGVQGVRIFIGGDEADSASSCVPTDNTNICNETQRTRTFSQRKSPRSHLRLPYRLFISLFQPARVAHLVYLQVLVRDGKVAVGGIFELWVQRGALIGEEGSFYVVHLH